MIQEQNQNTEPLVIRNGKLYRGDVEVRPICGDDEMIRCVRRYDKLRKEFSQEGAEVDLDVEIRYQISFKCICGTIIRVDGDTIPHSIGLDIEESISDDLPQKCICRNCGYKYRIDSDDEDFSIKAYLKE